VAPSVRMPSRTSSGTASRTSLNACWAAAMRGHAVDVAGAHRAAHVQNQFDFGGLTGRFTVVGDGRGGRRQAADQGREQPEGACRQAFLYDHRGTLWTFI
jgi:hypothetical protein